MEGPTLEVLQPPWQKEPLLDCVDRPANEAHTRQAVVARHVRHLPSEIDIGECQADDPWQQAWLQPEQRLLHVHGVAEADVGDDQIRKVGAGLAECAEQGWGQVPSEGEHREGGAGAHQQLHRIPQKVSSGCAHAGVLVIEA